LLKCLFFYYIDVNFGKEHWRKVFQRVKNHDNALHKGGNERDGWIGFVISSYYENLLRLIHADCLIKGLKAELSVFHLAVFLLSIMHCENAIV